MYKFTKDEVSSFGRGLYKAVLEIDQNTPDMIMAPMLGAVPLIDGINVITANLENAKILYVPASSGITDVETIMPKTVANALHEKLNLETILNKPFKVMSIDEVVGGGSAVRVYRGVTNGFRSYADKKASQILKQVKEGKDEYLDYFEVKPNTGTPELRQKISNFIFNQFKYKSIGIEQGTFNKVGKKHQPTYQHLVENGTIIPVEVERILTMDNPDFCPAAYVRRTDDPTKFYPTVQDKFTVTEHYLNLMKDIATTMGSDIDVSPKNLKMILDHQKYVPAEFHAPKAEQQTLL